jgi:hypothetical protein
MTWPKHKKYQPPHEDIAGILPSTFYAGLDLPQRIALLVKQWQRLILINHQLESELEVLTEEKPPIT